MNTTDTAKSGKETLTSDELIERLKKALQKNGDFPASAKVVTELRMLTSDPKTTAAQVTEVILREPSLGTRVLHLVNSSFYRRAKPIMTVSQAVIQVGMKPLAELCAGLILLQKFLPAARESGPFATCLKKTIVTSLLSSSLGNEASKARQSAGNESGFLAGTFAEMGTLLLAYYFPNVYESALKRADSKKVELAQAIKEITGLSPLRISMEVIKALSLPDYYLQVLEVAETGKSSLPEGSLPPEKQDMLSTGKSVHVAQSLSTLIVSNKGKAEIDAVLEKAKGSLKLDIKLLHKVVGELPNTFREHCAATDLALPALPDFVAAYASPEKKQEQKQKEADTPDQFTQFLDEIRQSVEAREPTASIITTVMETFAWGLKFDRVLLLLVDASRKNLRGRMLLGSVEGFDPTACVRPIGKSSDPSAPDTHALLAARPIFAGEPIFEEGWPLVAVPVGFGERAIGVVYADKVNSAVMELTSREQAAIGVLAELMDKSIRMQKR